MKSFQYFFPSSNEDTIILYEKSFTVRIYKMLVFAVKLKGFLYAEGFICRGDFTVHALQDITILEERTF